MSLFPVARSGARGLFGIRAAFSAVTLVSLVVIPHHAHAAGAQAADVFKRMLAVYQSANTYQGAERRVQTGKSSNGKNVTVTTTQHIKYKRPNKLYQSLTESFTGIPGQHNISATIVGDGKNMWIYNPQQKTYQKRPAPPSVPAPGDGTILQLAQLIDTGSAKLLADTTVAGRPAYVLEAMPVLPPTMPAAQRAQVLSKIKPLRLTIDKGNYYLVRAYVAGMGGTQSFEFSNQTVNASISDSAFAFTPPAGAKLVTPQAPPGFGSAPPPGAPKR